MFVLKWLVASNLCAVKLCPKIKLRMIHFFFNGFSDRPIPAANIDLHYAHCSRNLEKCKVCGDMVPKKIAEDHYLSTHAPVREILSIFFLSVFGVQF